MIDYGDETGGVLKAVERWENEGGRFERIYLAPDADARHGRPRAGFMSAVTSRQWPRGTRARVLPVVEDEAVPAEVWREAGDTAEAVGI